jgi:DNA-binding NarL/FixJ family response regulator
MNPIRCLIVDDHAQVRTMLCSWLESVFPGVAFVAAATGEAALELTRSCAPQVVLMDVSLPGMSGIEATRRIKDRRPETFIIIHTIHEDQAYRTDATTAGADAYVSKRKTQTELIPALETAFSAVGYDGVLRA